MIVFWHQLLIDLLHWFMKFIGLIFTAIYITFSFSCCQELSTPLNVERIKVELDSIMLLDQKYRNELQSLNEEFGYESIEFQTILRKQHQIDSTNLIYVEDLIQQFGKYPGKSLVGLSRADVAFYILQHSDPSIQEKYLDLILEASEQSELMKRNVALYHDRYLLNKGEPQIYGSQVHGREVMDSVTDTKELEYYLPPIRDTNNIDSLRMWNGLGPLENQLKPYGLSRWD